MTAPRTAAARCRLRTLVRWCVFLLLAVGLVETWLVGGLVVPCRVVGGSMAGALLGVHRDVVCGDCGYSFPCGAHVPPPPARAVCPNCGYAGNDLESLPEVDADRVWIDRTAFSIRAPRRWEIAAFRQSPQADKIAVKRVVGLPGESIEIRHGDVYVNGQIQRKNLAQQRALAVLVYDADFQSTRGPRGCEEMGTGTSPDADFHEDTRGHSEPVPISSQPSPRWRAERSDSRWNVAGGRFAHAAASDRAPVDWLVYHHYRESPVTDLCGYNQSQPRREEDVHPVTDLMLSFRLGRVSGRGSFFIRIADGSHSFLARMQFDDLGQRPGGSPSPGHRPGITITVTRISGPTGQPFGEPLARWADNDGSRGQVPQGDALGLANSAPSGQAKCYEVPATDTERLVEVSLVDQQFLLAVDGQTIVAWPYDRPEPPRSPPSCPPAIGVQGLEVTVCGLRVYRDVYYTHPIGPQGRRGIDRPARLAADQYYVLGDNSPVSEDSRTWPEAGAVDAKLLVGKPLVAIPSVPLSLWGWWHFQVPNPVEIRYIR